jgi:8-oxo-dGTP diphosphatase
MSESALQVAVAVIVNDQREVLLALRDQQAHQGGLWEFPGGKIEADETVMQALAREVREELGIEISRSVPFKSIQYAYPDKQVMLHFFLVDAFHGAPAGAEGQPLKWLAIDSLKPSLFPAANRSIIRALQLPQTYMISGRFISSEDFLARLYNSLNRGVRLLQMRCPELDARTFTALAQQATQLCAQFDARLLLNTTPAIYHQIREQGYKPAGLHLNGRLLNELKQRPLPADEILSVSCHNLQDIAQASRLAADCLLYSPIKATHSHPEAKPLGWQAFADAVAASDICSYALGGMQLEDIDQARSCGGQGIAAISCLWHPHDDATG